MGKGVDDTAVVHAVAHFARRKDFSPGLKKLSVFEIAAGERTKAERERD